MLDHVERGRFLVEPAREYAVPSPVGLLNIDLDEGAGQLLVLPRRGRFAGAQADDHVLPPRRLAGAERNVLDDSVSLVEDPDDGDALRHWRDSALSRGGRRHLAGGAHARILLLRAAGARSERDCNQQGCGGLVHAYSGIHGS